ncbi:MAG: hypothetical protein ABH837_02515 [bacterium]
MPVGPVTFEDSDPVSYKRKRKLEYLIRIIDDSLWKSWKEDGSLQSRCEIEIRGYYDDFPEDSIQQEVIGIYKAVGWQKVELLKKEKHFTVILEY